MQQVPKIFVMVQNGISSKKKYHYILPARGGASYKDIKYPGLEYIFHKHKSKRGDNRITFNNTYYAKYSNKISKKYKYRHAWKNTDPRCLTNCKDAEYTC